MTPLLVGSLFAGYGGLEMGLALAFGQRVRLAWYSEIDRGACRVMAHHHPDVVNLGDVTKIDWRGVRRVDILCGGFPCQDLSEAGKQAGLRDGTRSGLWSEFAKAIAELRPRLVLIENVRGILSADAHSDLECEACLGALRGEPAMRALGAVLGDLAEIGYDAAWHGLRVADVGGCHGRHREFILAWPSTDPDDVRLEWLRLARDGWAGSEDHDLTPLIPTPTASDYKGATAGRKEPGAHRGQLDAFVEGGTLLPTPRAIDSTGVRGRTENRSDEDNARAGLTLTDVTKMLPTPRATDGTKGGPNQRGSSGDLMLPSAVHALLPTPGVAGGGKQVPEDAVWNGKAAYKPDGTKVQVHIDQIAKLLPTPVVTDMGANRTPEEWDEWTAEMRERHNNGVGHGDSLSVEVARLMPTPTTKTAGNNMDGDTLLPHIHKVSAETWGEYAPAIVRWENLTRPAPAPTEPGPSGPRLSPVFEEWMMGLPEGHVTAPEIWGGWKGSSRNTEMKILGNGVVPQQAAAGIRACLEIACMAVDSAWSNTRESKAWTRVLRKAVRSARAGK